MAQQKTDRTTSRKRTAPMGGGGNGFAPHSDVPADTSDFAPQPVGARSNAPAEDDIPF